MVAVLSAACAAPIQRPMAVTAPPPLQLSQQAPSPRYTAQSRPSIGVAFGGGSARGIAHVGVIRWLEEHRIPIDVAAGTSMGGLIGGSFATGHGRRRTRRDARGDRLGSRCSGRRASPTRTSAARPTRGPTRPGWSSASRAASCRPTSLNNGEQVELLLGRIAAPYHELDHFDRLPTPFRTVAVDLVSATEVVLRSRVAGPGDARDDVAAAIFPPVERDGRVLVDGGAMNNVPADVVRAMGADRVIAVNVGDLADREDINYTHARPGRRHARRDDAGVDQVRRSPRPTSSSTCR